jgi:hypothetical protein
VNEHRSRNCSDADTARTYDPLWRAIEAFDLELRGLEEDVRVLAEWCRYRNGYRPSRRDDAAQEADGPSH